MPRSGAILGRLCQESGGCGQIVVAGSDQRRQIYCGRPADGLLARGPPFGEILRTIFRCGIIPHANKSGDPRKVQAFERPAGAAGTIPPSEEKEVQ
jgi:hypothetical protein